MKKIKLICVAALLVAMIVSFTGCGDVSTSGDDTSKFVTISMHLIGEKPRDYDEVLTKVNEILKEKINTNIDVKWIASGDASTKYQLILQSGESVDLIYSNTWTNYVDNAKKGGYYPLDELLPKYAPETYKKLGAEPLECLMVDGKLYSVPMNYKDIQLPGYAVRGDLMKKYGIESIDNFDEFWAYLNAVSKEKGIKAYNCNTNDAIINMFMRDRGWNAGKDAGVYYRYEDPTEIKYLWNIPAYEEYINLMRDGFEKGFWSKDILMAKNTSVVNFENGTSAASVMSLGNFNAAYIRLKDTHPEWDIKWFGPAKQYPDIINQYGGMSIGAKCNNPERAMMVLECIRTDEELFDLMTYGIRGKHFDKNDKNELICLDQDGFKADESGAWGMREEEFVLNQAGSWSEFKTQRDDYLTRAEYSPLGSFGFDNSSVVNELAAISSVKQQFGPPLDWGVTDVEEGFKILKDKLSEAGLDKVEKEYIKQFKEYYKNNK